MEAIKLLEENIDRTLSDINWLTFFNLVGEDSWESLGLQGNPTSQS